MINYSTLKVGRKIQLLGLALKLGIIIMEALWAEKWGGFFVESKQLDEALFLHIF